MGTSNTSRDRAQALPEGGSLTEKVRVAQADDLRGDRARERQTLGAIGKPNRLPQLGIVQEALNLSQSAGLAIVAHAEGA